MGLTLEKTQARFAATLAAHAEATYKELSAGRFGEEREWRESGLFYQRKQWIDWLDDKQRFVQVKPSKTKPQPMPVSNYFAKTINANANALGSMLVRMTVTPTDDDPQSRRAAEYAEMAKDAIDEETQMRLHNPLLAKHTAIWGLGVMKDTLDTSTAEGAIDAPEMGEDVRMQLGCFDCGGTYDISAEDAAESAMDAGDVQVPCPQCGSNTTEAYTISDPVVEETHRFGKGKIKSKVLPIFEVYVPRDCQNPNLATRIVHRYRLSLNKAKHDFADHKDEFKADPKSDLAEIGYDDLTTLVGGRAQENQQETVTFLEVWSKWEELPEKLQQAIEEEFGETPELQEMMRYGIFIICAGKETLVDFGPNPYVDLDTDEGFFPFTFFLWEVDPASPYPKGMGIDLKPLQRRLNRCDALIELGMMSNAAGKWLWPSTQTTKPPSGTPGEVAEWDPIGDGKHKPEFVQPSPFHPSVWQLRNTILMDFEALGLLPQVMQGKASSGEAFRTVAYLGAKAAEQISTQRFLWETAHRLRYKKLFCIAKAHWDEERKVRVAGHNGRLMYQSVMGEDLRGNYEVDYVPDSSRPKSLDEKVEAVQMLFAAGLINPTDPSVRKYIMDMLNLEGLNFADEVQYDKAARDLEKLKRGELPLESPYQRWEIFLKTMSEFTLTEDYEELSPEIQTFILVYCERLNLMVSQVNMEMEQNAVAQAVNAAGATAAATGAAESGGAAGGEKALSKVPGQTASVGATENAAEHQGNSFAGQLK